MTPAWLETFFGAGNGLKWNNPKVQDELRPYLKWIDENAPVAALPRKGESDGKRTWYVVWRDGVHARFVREFARAFLGRSYSDLGIESATVNAKDPLERLLAEQFGGNVLRLGVSEKHALVAKQRISRMLQLVNRRPLRSGHRFRAVGRLLRDFEFALQQADDTAALACLAELRRGGHLEQLNHAALDLRRLASQCRWSEVLAHGELGAVVDVGAPTLVASAIFQAIYAQQLAPFEFKVDAEGARDFVREQVLPRFGALFRSRRGLSGFAVDVLFLLRAAALREAVPDISLVLGRYQSGSAQHTYLSAIAGLLTGPPPTAPVIDALGEATRLFFEDVDRAFTIARDAPPCVARTRLLLKCALDLIDDAALGLALTAFEDLKPAEKTALELEPRFLGQLTTARRQVAAPPPSPARDVPSVDSWLSWLQRLALPTPWDGAMACLERWVATWDFESVAADPQAVQGARNLLENTLPDWSIEPRRRALPHLVNALSGEPVDPRLDPLREVMFDLLATDDAPSIPLCGALLQLARSLLNASPSRARYVEILHVIVARIKDAETPSAAPVVLDALELLIGTYAVDASSRVAAATKLGSMLSGWWQRLDRAERSLGRGLLVDLKVPDILPPPEPEPVATAQSSGNPWARLGGKYVAIYSLNEASLNRVRTALLSLCPSARVEIFNDHVGGAAPLRAAARSADIFVVVTGAAKHSATEFITEQRPANHKPLFASGKGSSSILAAISGELIAA